MSTPSPHQPAEPAQVRIGTKEREAAYAALNTHLEAGRLDAEEYGERYSAASVARTRPELEALFTDLPEPHPFPAPVAAQPSWVPNAGRRAPGYARLLPALYGLIPFAAIALVVTTHVWLFFLLIPAAVSVFGRCGWGGRGPSGRGYGGRRYGGYGGPGW